MKLIEKIKRKKTLLQFGFGADVMKTTTVCTNCKSMEKTDKPFCSKCGAKLPVANLYDYYNAQHKHCPDCGSIITDSMNYCPKCGKKIEGLMAL